MRVCKLLFVMLTIAVVVSGCSKKWGAYACSPETLNCSEGSDIYRATAEAEAKNACGDNCEVWSSQSCLAIVRGEPDTEMPWFAGGESEQDARYRAKENCEAGRQTDCKVASSFCPK